MIESNTREPHAGFDHASLEFVGKRTGRRVSAGSRSKMPGVLDILETQPEFKIVMVELDPAGNPPSRHS